MYKILIASSYNSPNTYVRSIVDELSKTDYITCDIKCFWESSSVYDIIHIQWLEELFNWNEVTLKDLKMLNKRLFFWKSKGAKIVITRHNEFPHRNLFLDKDLYEVGFSNADAVVHLGKYSLEKLETKGTNVYIPHVNYFPLVDTVNTKSARIYLNLPKKGNLYLSFGVIRNDKEESQIIRAFQRIRTKEDYLLICNTLKFNKKPSYKHDFFKRMKYNIQLYKYKKAHVFFKRKRILNDELKYYFSAANVVISSRLNTINSGVIYMGFSFSKVVLGPDIGNIGPVLNQLGNPVFEPENVASIAKAMVTARKKVGTNVENMNYEYAKTECSPKVVAKKHRKLYTSLLKI